MLAGAQGRLDVTDFEAGAVHRRSPEGRWALVARAPERPRPDTLALEADGTLLVTATQLPGARGRGGGQEGAGRTPRPTGEARRAADAGPDCRAGPQVPSGQ
jgi:sugar lactone lactonase YvrE